MATNNSWTRPRSASNGRHPASAVNFRYSVSRSRTRHQHCYSTHLSYSPRPCNYLMPGIEIKLPPVPAGLKSVSSFISRAQELKGKDPVIAYYCLYHAVNVGMEPKNKDKEMTAFLVKLMDTLEQMKDQLKDRKEINSSEAAATYIENFALKVFHNADNEDRKGGSNRSTAKKFLAASNFFELLTLFDKKYLNADIQPEEKIKYAKWKAADIAKAFREGRVPLAGPALTLDGSEDDLMNERMTSSFSEHEDPSLGSSMGAPSTHIPQSSATKTSDEPARHSPENDTSSKPTLPKMDSSSSTHTVTHPKTSGVVPIPKHISTSAPPTTPPYVIDLSPNSTLSLGPKTPLRTPGISDGSWSTAATPGIESPNPMSPYSSFSSATGAKVALNLLNSGAAARLNATSNSGKGDSPLSPGLSPKPKSSLGAAVFTASDLEAKTESDPKKSHQEEGGDTDDEWSIAGNDPFSRQNSMMPAASFHHAPGVTITSTLDMVKEDESQQSTSLSAKHADAGHKLTTPNVLAVPLPSSASNTRPSSPNSRPDSVAYAASHPLPPVLPPSVQTPSSIKSESHALPTEGSNEKIFKYTSNVVGDSTSDGEASYNVRRRANSASEGLKPQTNGGKAGEDSHHVRSTSVTTAPSTQSTFALSPNGAIDKSRVKSQSSQSSAEDDWERQSLSRIARLPDSVSGSDMDSLSGRLRDLGAANSSSSLTPTTSTPAVNGDPDHEWKSRRNTIRGSAPPNFRMSDPDISISLPGVPSAPPVGDWGSGKGSGDSDSGGEADMMARLPSAPGVPPNVQDRLPHVTVFPKPSSPRDEHTTHHFPPHPTGNQPQSKESHEFESPVTPRSRTHSRAPSTTQTSTISPSYNGVGQSPSVASPSSIHRGYTPPNSSVSSNGPSIAGQHPHFPPSGLPHPASLGHYNPTAPVSVPPQFYGNVQPSAPLPIHDEFGLGIPQRAPPTELDPETLGKVQKHTKFALSALNFEDLETAREELKKALRMLS